MKSVFLKIISVSLALVMLISAVPFMASAETYSGKCGDNLTWTLNESTGELVISGTGEMADYLYNSHAPWYGYRSKIKSVSLSDELTSIGTWAFDGCTDIKYLKMPASAKIANAFYDCANIEKVTLTKGTGTMCDYSLSSDSYETCYEYTPWYVSRRKCTEIVIEDGVRGIGDYAFYGCTGITDITIPDGVANICEYTFRGCTNLKSITIGEGVTEIGDYAFYGCTSLTDVTIPNGVTQFGESAFYGCVGLTNLIIPDGVTYIDDYTFYGCSGLTNVTIPDGVMKIGRYAFYDCTSIKNLTMPASAKLYYNAFGNCTNIEKVTLTKGTGMMHDYGDYPGQDNQDHEDTPWNISRFKCTEIVIEYGVRHIGASAFEDCYNLASIAIPNSVQSIGTYAFYSCDNLDTVTLPISVKSIGYEAFYGCSNLEKLKVYNRNCAFRDDFIGKNTTLCGYSGSTAETCATKYGYMFELITEDDHEHVYSNCYSDKECNICGYVRPKPVHSYTSVVTAPTCTERGYTTYTCFCGQSKIDDYVDATGHNFADWKVTTEATCTKMGVETRECIICEATEIRELEMIEHAYNSVVTIPSCTSQGYTTYICYCGDSYIDDYVDALKHDFGEWKVTIKSTCTKEGVETRECENCDETETREISATGHTAGEWVVTTPATATQNGEKMQSCTECGTTLGTQSIPAYGKVRGVSIDDISMNYKDSSTITPSITVDSGVKYAVTYSSSNPSVVSVDANGKVTTSKTGSATITVTVKDEFGNTVSDTCTVKVNYNWWQWIIVIVLFGWIWY